MKRFFKFLFLVTFFGMSVATFAQTTNYQVHSLFVLNIAKYSTWPAHGSEFNITIFGKSKIYDELVKQANGKTINGVPVKVKLAETLSDIGNPNIIYLSDNKSSSLDEVLNATTGKSIMVIAEREGLFKKGAGFSFVLMENNTLRYDINNAENEKRQIKVSKNLVSLANTTIM